MGTTSFRPNMVDRLQSSTGFAGGGGEFACTHNRRILRALQAVHKGDQTRSTSRIVERDIDDLSRSVLRMQTSEFRDTGIIP